MSTPDVPGSNPANKDQLAMGCWAEHEDGSLVFVESTEGGHVVFSMFDLSSQPIMEFRDRFLEKDFKEKFSWKPGSKKVKWTWHDKKPFDWDRVIKAGAKDGVRHASAADQLSAARRVANALGITASPFDPDSIAHQVAQELPRLIQDKIQGAIDTLPAKSQKKIKKLQDKKAKLDAKIDREISAAK